MAAFNIRPILACATCTLVFLSPSAPAQVDEEEITGDGSVEEIIVTGSRLIRRDFTAPSPITTINREALEYSSQATLEGVLNQMPQVMPDLTRSTNNGGDGTARINLRGFGSQRSLVMLNGRRMAASGIGTAVDINNLPQKLIERVEIITGGASTVYGSDAVAGVINFITRKDFDGFALDISGYTTGVGDSNEYDLTASYGHNFANGNGNITIFGGYYDREELLAGERELSYTEFCDCGEGELVPFGSFRAPEGVFGFPEVDWGNGPAGTIFMENGDPREFIDPDDRYNYAPENYIQTPLTRYTGGLFLNYDLGARSELYVEAAHTQNEWVARLAPVPAGGFTLFTLDNPVMTPTTQQFFADNAIPMGPGLVMAWVARRLEEIGPRIIEENRKYTRFVAGIKGDIGSDWEFDAWVTYTKGDEQTRQLNDGSRSRFQQGLLIDPATGQCIDPSNGCVPVNIFGAGNMSAEAVDFLRLPPLVNITEREQVLVSGYVRGDLFDTWAGTAQAAFGVEWREDDGSYTADDYLFSGDTLGYRGDSPVVGSESVFEIYTEMLLPLASETSFAEYLGLEIGGRYSDYEFAGGVTTWKAGLEWQVNSTLRLRGMAQHSVRAPNLRELFREQVREDAVWVFDPEDDPCSVSADPVGSGNVDACIATGMPANQIGIFEAQPFPMVYVTGGNPDLEPEESDTLTAGIVITPSSVPELQIAIDYFELELDGGIDNLFAEVTCFDPANVDQLFCDAFTRDPVTFNVIEIRETLINRGLLITSGIDTQIKYGTELPSALSIRDAGADLDLSIIWTHLNESSFQGTPWGTSIECAGYFGWPCNAGAGWTETYPADRVTTNLSYASGDLTAHLSWRWIDGTKIAEPQGDAIIGWPVQDYVITEVGNKNYLDLGIGYQFNDQLAARLVIANLTDTDAPFMASHVFAGNTDPSMFDIYGRAYTLSFALSY